MDFLMAQKQPSWHIPRCSMYGLFTYIRWKMATFKGKCRQIFPTWSIWDMIETHSKKGSHGNGIFTYFYPRHPVIPSQVWDGFRCILVVQSYLLIRWPWMSRDMTA